MCIMLYMCLPLKLCVCFSSVWEVQQISYSDICEDIASFFSLSKTAPSSSDLKALGRSVFTKIF